MLKVKFSIYDLCFVNILNDSYYFPSYRGGSSLTGVLYHAMYFLNHIFLLITILEIKIILFQAKRQTKRSPGMKPWSKVR